MNRKLYRSRDGQMVAGVCAGLGKYLDMDPTVIRVLFALLAVFGGGGILLYIIMMIVIPEEPVGGLEHPTSSRPVASSTASEPMDSEAIVSSPAPKGDEPIDPGL